MFKTNATFKAGCCAAVLALAGVYAGEPPTPVSPNPIPNPNGQNPTPKPPKISPIPANLPPNNEPPSAVIHVKQGETISTRTLERALKAAKKPDPVAEVEQLSKWLADLQGADEAKRKAAHEGFVNAGQRGYNYVVALLSNKDPEIVKRAEGVRDAVEKRSFQMLKDAGAQQVKISGKPWIVAELEDVKDAWQAAVDYTPVDAVRMNALTHVEDIQKTIKDVMEAQETLGNKDYEFTSYDPRPTGIHRSAIEIERAKALKTLARDAEAMKAAVDAESFGGPTGRFTAAALKVQAELHERAKRDKERGEACQKIIKNYGRCPEVVYAFNTMIELSAQGEKWDEAIGYLKDLHKIAPLSDEAKDHAEGLLTTIFGDNRDYDRAEALALWIREAFPPQQVPAEAYKLLGGICEYVRRDYNRAAEAYTRMMTDFKDQVDEDEGKATMDRIAAKQAGKFPSGPTELLNGPAGALGKFFAAVRANDKSKLAACVPAAEIENVGRRIGDSGDELRAGIIFADYVVTKADIKGEKAVIRLDYYDPASAEKKILEQEAVLENGAWKINWKNPDEAEVEEPDPAAQQPAQPQPEVKK